MDEIKEALCKNYAEVEDLINELEVGTEEYNAANAERDKIRNEWIKIEEIKKEYEFKEAQLQSENKKETIRNAIEVAKSVAEISVSVVLALWTFEFDKTGTITSTIGKGILNVFTPPKIFRK